MIKRKFSFLLFSFQFLFIFVSFGQKSSDTVYKDSEVVNFFRRTKGWVAGDGAFTVPLSNGKILWIMGDSFIDTYDL